MAIKTFDAVADFNFPAVDNNIKLQYAAGLRQNEFSDNFGDTLDAHWTVTVQTPRGGAGEEGSAVEAGGVVSISAGPTANRGKCIKTAASIRFPSSVTVETELANINFNAGAGQCGLVMALDVNNYIQFTRRGAGDLYIYTMYGGVGAALASVATGVLTCKLRIVIDQGGTFLGAECHRYRCYYDIGAGWVLLRTWTPYLVAPLTMELFCDSGATAVACSADFTYASITGSGWFWNDLASCQLIEAATTYTLDAGAGNILTLLGLHDNAAPKDTANYEYRIAASNAAAWPGAGWSAWYARGAFSEYLRAGTANGTRYAFIECRMTGEYTTPVIPYIAVGYLAGAAVYTDRGMMVPSGDASMMWCEVADDGKFKIKNNTLREYPWSKDTLVEMERVGTITQEFISTLDRNALFYNHFFIPDWHKWMSYPYYARVSWARNFANTADVVECGVNVFGQSALVGALNRDIGGEVADSEVYWRMWAGGWSQYGIFVRASFSAATYYQYCVVAGTHADIIKCVAGVETQLAHIALGTGLSNHYFRALTVGPILKFKWWDPAGPEPVVGGPDNDGYQIKVYDYELTSGYIGLGGYGEPAGGTKAEFFEVFEIKTRQYDTTSPIMFDRWDSLEDDSTWGDEIIFKTLLHGAAGTTKVKVYCSNTLYGRGDGAVIAAAVVAQPWSTPDAVSGVVTGKAGTGRYRYILYQFNSTGAQNPNVAIFDFAQTMNRGGGDATAGSPQAIRTPYASIGAV